ncbi:SDR family NAD(P)-dependent oxidoreductase [Neisseria lisongii]|uniref:SDR family NAD(P)-dependent oxidoreductase n=1 Tax=Neisseria lisongii TaxID=2912188 RepID=A0AAW5ANU1_9NEIS|nr:SDR family NAD(P)-dependent oxidoreductase [Neisseria lisongii]MCF7528735.1 SDR family NAD(P)-dependent oxidoreductase [Neisseria lisongii]MCF7529593.1 SDR family NAD(P)-dependent oxidoreductase [Neisseria lisongii]
MQKIIISGHSRGLGKALAEHYLAQGVQVLGLSRTLLPEQAGLTQIALDLQQTDTLSAWLAQGGLQHFIAEASEVVLINNAATVEPCAVAGRQRPSEIAAAVQLNIAAPLMLSNDLLHIRQAGQTVKIVHIGSGAGRKAYAGWSVYGATKAALDHHARCLAAEQHERLNIASIAPGVVDTEMQAQIRSQDKQDFPLLNRFQQLQADGGLTSPQTAAETIAHMIADDDFGLEPIQDVRTWQALQDSLHCADAIRISSEAV